MRRSSVFLSATSAAHLLATGTTAAAGLYGIGAGATDTLPNHWTTGANILYDDSVVSTHDATRSIVSQFATSDPAAAAAFLQNLPDDDPARSAALSSFLENWFANQQDSPGREDDIWSRIWEISANGRPPRDRGDTDLDGNGPGGRPTTDTGPDSASTSIPESSFALIGAIGLLALLLRRRSS